MLISCKVSCGPDKPNIDVLMHSPRGMTYQEMLAFRKRRIWANRSPRKGESRNERKARIEAKKHYDRYRPQFPATVQKEAPGFKVGDPVTFDEVDGTAKPVPPVFIGYRLGVVSFDGMERDTPLPTHMKNRDRS